MSTATTATKVRVKKGRANPLWQGHPWLFSGAIDREEGSAAPGDVVDVLDTDGRFIGRGFINPRSQIRVRMLSLKEEEIDAAWVKRRVEQARDLRVRLGLPNEGTNAYRLINSEGDGLPGVVVDVYGDVLAVQFTALGCKRIEEWIYDALASVISPRAIVEVAAGGFSQLEGFTSSTRVVRGDGVEKVECRENGIRLDVEPLGGQKTGMFLDQRENRRRIGALAKDAEVLDVYTYAGGFALNALKGGAKSATCVDSSARALERARGHAEKNQLSPLVTEEADAFRFLETVRPRAFDLIILDPPKFARAQKDLDAALKGYRRLNALAMTAAKEGAILATASCSGLVDEESFERAISGAAKDSGRRVQILEIASQGPDHPVPPGFREGRYLKFVLTRIE